MTFPDSWPQNGPFRIQAEWSDEGGNHLGWNVGFDIKGEAIQNFNEIIKDEKYDRVHLYDSRINLTIRSYNKSKEHRTITIAH